MRIGIDLDGVIFDSEKQYRVYAELYEVEDLKKNSIKENREIRVQERYSWTKEEFEGFMKKYHKKVTLESNFMPGAKNVMKLLKEQGHELVLITARGRINSEMIPLTEERLKQNKMDIFDKYYWATENKDEICINENIDIMIDDSYSKCKSVSESKIKTIYLKDAPSYNLEENEYLKILYNWGEIYRYIKEQNG